MSLTNSTGSITLGFSSCRFSVACSWHEKRKKRERPKAAGKKKPHIVNLEVVDTNKSGNSERFCEVDDWSYARGYYAVCYQCTLRSGPVDCGCQWKSSAQAGGRLKLVVRILPISCYHPWQAWQETQYTTDGPWSFSIHTVNFKLWRLGVTRSR